MVLISKFEYRISTLSFNDRYDELSDANLNVTVAAGHTFRWNILLNKRLSRANKEQLGEICTEYTLSTIQYTYIAPDEGILWNFK